MQVGKFVFDFPVWVLTASPDGGNSSGPVCKEFEGIPYFAVYTDNDLAFRASKNLQLLQVDIRATCLQNTVELVSALLQVLNGGYADHVAVDPIGGQFPRMPIPDFIQTLEVQP